MVERPQGRGSRLSRRALLHSAALASLAAAVPCASTAAIEPRREMSFDADWRFLRGDAADAHRPEFDDASWRHVQLPHDWSIEDLPGAPETTAPWTPPAALWSVSRPPPTEPGPFQLASVPPTQPGGPPLRVGPFDAEASAGAGNTGWVVGGTGWYRKSFRSPQRNAGERVELRFDGAFQECEVWLNGESLGVNIYGYGGFAFDLTSRLRPAALNTLAVRVRNVGETSRWYSGSGLYRHVWLTVTGPVRVSTWGLSVSTPQISETAATAVVEVEIEGQAPAGGLVDVDALVRDPAGKIVAAGRTQAHMTSGTHGKARIELTAPHPLLWAPDHPALYRAEVTLAVGGRTTDRTTTRFGIRSIAASAERGLTINGQPVKLKGACIHADNGILGAAAIDRAEVRKVELLKSYGYNAIRAGHQMFSPAFMDACDELGMLVQDEVFDTWEQAKWLKNDYSHYFKSNWKHDLTRLIVQHRNHPSVIFWSIGNEIPEANTPRGVEIAAELRHTALELDSSRLITAALVAPFGREGEPERRSLDVVGYNYRQDAYEEDHKAFPNLVFMSTEQFSRDMYDGWRKVEAYPWVLGEFIWTGMDYLGEVGSGSSELRPLDYKPPSRKEVPYLCFLWDYPAFQAGCGEIDINGQRKPQGLYRDVLWGRSKLELLVQRPTPAGTYERISDWGWHDELESWTWSEPADRPMTVRAYTPGDSVQLVLNGRTIARKTVGPADKLKAEFEVGYAPGELVTVAFKGGVEIARKTLQTVGAPAKLRLRAERTHIAGSPDDLGYVFAEVCDAQGRRVPDASLPLTFAVEGAARLRASGSANPRGLKSFSSPQCTTFHGEALAIVQPTAKTGQAVLRVDSPGLAGDQLAISIR